MLIIILFLTTLFLAYSNSANDNFKGVATLYGSGTLNYNMAISIATVMTFIGSICAIFLAQGLIASFSGKGLVPQEIAGTTDFLIAVGFGAACTVLLATRLGFPISTTHSLVGGLVGAGLMAVGLDINFYKLGGAFFLPLLISPLLAFILGILLYGCFTKIRKKMELTKESYLCLGEQKELVPIHSLTSIRTDDNVLDMSQFEQTKLELMLAENNKCIDIYTKTICNISLQTILDFAHIVSAATVSFARGLNDTPKIAGLLVATQAYDIQKGMIIIAVAMATGGLISAHRVAETVSNKITRINHGQGFSANLVTSFLVIFASQLGVPVSTTHVSVGSIFGIGIVNKNHNTRVVRSILLSWLITLPIALSFSASMYWFLS